MMSIKRGGSELIPQLQPLWEALFGHHLRVGAAGIPTIRREDTWPIRHEHYERPFAESSHGAVWLVSIADRTIGYASGITEEHRVENITVLETLSILPEARGRGIGSRLISVVEEAAREWHSVRYAVDVLTGNEQARQLYVRSGFESKSETWLRSHVPGEGYEPVVPQLTEATIKLAGAIGLDISTSVGPDDTRVSATRIADLVLPTPPIPDTTQQIPPSPRKLDSCSFAELILELDRNGIWTSRIELPVDWLPQNRDVLQDLGYHRSIERLTRPLR